MATPCPAFSAFAPESDMRFENPKRPNDFPGRPLGTDPSIAKESGIHDVRPIKSLGAQIRSWGERGRVIWLNPGRGGPINRSLGDFQRLTHENASWLIRQICSCHVMAAIPSIR